MTGLFSLFRKQRPLINTTRDRAKKRKFNCSRCGADLQPAGMGLFICPACGFRKRFY